MRIIPGHAFSVSLAAIPPNSKELAMVWSSPGAFLMGSPEDEPGRSTIDDEPQFEVTLTGVQPKQ